MQIWNINIVVCEYLNVFLKLGAKLMAIAEVMEVWLCFCACRFKLWILLLSAKKIPPCFVYPTFFLLFYLYEHI